MPSGRQLALAGVEGRGYDAERIGRAPQQADAPEDRVVDDVELTVAVPVRHRKRGVAPLGLARSLDRATRTGQDSKGDALGFFDEHWGGPLGQVVFAETKVLKEANVPGGVAAEDVVQTVAVPVDHEGRGQRPELQRVRFLLKIDRLMEKRHAVAHLAAVLDQGRPGHPRRRR